MEKPISGSIEVEDGDEATRHILPHGHNSNCKCNGDCFFESVAQTLLQAKPSETNINVKCLRKLCEQFAKEALKSNQPSWFIDHMDKEFREGRISHQEYISRIGLTICDASHGEPINFHDVVWGQVEVEGRIISEKYHVQLHVTETKIVKGQERLTDQYMDKDGNIPTLCNCNDDELIHILSKGNKHFEPVLRSKQTASNYSQEDMTMDNFYKKFVEAIQSNCVPDLKNVLDLSSMRETHDFKFLEEGFGIQNVFAAMVYLSKKFESENELLDVVCTSLEYYVKYAESFLIQKGLTHHRLNHAFFLLVSEKYENWMEIRNTANDQIVKSIPRKLFKEIQVYLTKLLFPLGEYAKILMMNDQLRQMRLDFLKVNEYPMKYFENAQKHEYFNEMDHIKAIYQMYNFGELQLNLVNDLYNAFANANKQTEEELSTNIEPVKLEHYLTMKDIYVLDRILSYVNLALSMEIKAEDMTYVDKLVLERALQVTGEYLKNTDDAPNLSEEVQAKLNLTGLKVDTLTDLRNMLSHHSTKQAFSDSNNTEGGLLLGNVRADLQKVKTVIVKVVRQLKIKQIHLLIAETSSNVSGSKSNNKQVVEQIQSLLDNVTQDTPSKDMKQSFEVLLNILKKHTNEELGNIKTSVQELLFVILPDVILQPLKKKEQEIWINSSLFHKINDGKLGFFDTDWLDNNSAITKISSLKLIEKYKQTKSGTDDVCLNAYGLTLTDVFLMVVSENLFSNKQLKAKTKKLKYGFQTDLDINAFEKVGIQNTFLQNVLSAMNKINAKDELNVVLEKFLKGYETTDNLLKFLNIEENLKVDLQSLLNEFRLQITQLSKPIDVLDKILETAVTAVKNQFNAADFQQINLKMKNKKETHIAKTTLATLCGGIKNVSQSTFLHLVENLHSDVNKKKSDEWYSNRRSCKTSIDRVKDSYGDLLKETGKDLKGMRKGFNSYTDSLEIKPEQAATILKKTIGQVIEDHFEKQFQNTVILIQNLRREIEEHNVQELKDDVKSHFIHKKRMMAALEMIVFKATNIIGAISTPDIFKKLEKLIHVTIGRSLSNSPANFSVRNYLAHGDAIIEMRNAHLSDYLNCVADYLVQHGRVIIAINRIMNDSLNSSVLLTFLSIQSLNEILDQNPVLYGREMEILQQSEYWKNQNWKTDLLNILIEKVDGQDSMHHNFDLCDFIKIFHEEMCTAVSFGDFNSIQFFLNCCQSRNINRLDMLHYAAENGNVDVIRFLLKQGFKINESDDTNCTPLHLAVLNQRTEAVKVLLDNKADVMAKDDNGYSALHMAAYLGNTELILYLIESSADSNVLSKFNVSPLLLAAWNCHYDATVALIQKGAHVNLPNDLSMTPLFCAAAKGQCEIVELLLSNGAEIDGNPSCMWSPIQVATIVKQQRAMELLIGKGANVNFRNVGYLTPLHYASTVSIAEVLLNAGADVFCSSDYGTPLHTTAHVGWAEVVKLLVKKGANIDAPNQNGLTTLHFMAFKGDIAMMKVLIDSGASVDIVADSASNKYKKVTPLHLACSYRQPKAVSFLLQHDVNINAVCLETETNKNRIQSHWPLKLAVVNQNSDIVNELLKHGADVNLVDDKDLTALHFAALKGPLDFVQQLLEKGADVNAITKGKMTPIYYATLVGFCDVMELLIENGADIYHKVRGETLLHVAAQRGHVKAAKLLIDKGIKVNVKGVHSKTALHWACAVWDRQNVSPTNNHSKLEMVQMLLENNADPNVQNFVHDTPLHIAAFNGDPELVKALLKYGGDANARNLTNVEGLYCTPMQAARQNGQIECLTIMKYWDSNTKHPRTDVSANPIKNNVEIYENEQLSAAEETWISELCKAVILGENIDDIDKLLAGKNTYASIDLNNYQLLHISTAKNDVTLMEKLIKHGLNIDHLSIEGSSPLHLAVKIKYPEATMSLLKFGANVNALTETQKQSALHIAVQNEHKDILSMLLKRDGINLESKNINNETPLILACKNGSEDIVKLLIQHNARINQDDEDQDAAIHAAVKNNQASIVDILLIKCANVTRSSGKEGNHPLHYCIHNNNLSIAERLIKKGATVNCVNVKNDTPLHIAVRLGNIEAVTFLLQHHAEVDGVVADTNTPLHLAVAMGNSTTVETLLENNANVIAQNGKKQTALHLAAIKGDGVIATKLLQKGAETEITDKSKCTPLFLAIKHVHNFVIDLLLQNGANVSAVCEYHLPTMHMAVQTSDVDIIKMVLDKGADVNCTQTNGWTPLHFATANDSLPIVALLIERGANVNTMDKANETPIHIACYSGFYEVAEKLIAAEANVNCFSLEEFSPLYMAVEQNKLDIIRLLLANGADVNLTSPNARICAMDAAIMNMDFNTVKILIDNNADVNITSEKGISFMHSAAYNGSKEILEILHTSGLSVDVRMANGGTPLHAAVERGHIDSVRYLIEEGADINATMKDDNVTPPLCVAIQNEHEDIAMALVALGANVNLTNVHGDSPLMYAAQKRMSNVVLCLINKGANVNAVNIDSQTALHIAISNKDSETEQHLLKNGANVDAVTKIEDASSQ